MKAIILAAGYATRLYPLTENFPKTLLKIAGKPILEYTIEKILECKEIDTIFVVTNRRFFDIFQKWRLEYQKKNAGISPTRLEIVNDNSTSNDDRLGSIGDLWFTIQSQNLNDDLLVICSDKMFEFKLCDFVKFFKEKKTAINACFEAGDIEKIRNKHGCAVLDPAGRIIEFQEKPAQPKSSIESVAFYIYPADAIPLIKEYIESGNNPDAPGHLARWLCQRIPMYAYLLTEKCYDVGTIEAYRRVNSIYEQLKRPG